MLLGCFKFVIKEKVDFLKIRNRLLGSLLQEGLFDPIEEYLYLKGQVSEKFFLKKGVLF